MYSGSIVALVTPFDVSGNIHFAHFENLIEWHIAQGSDGLVIAGTTGESATLSVEEKLSLFEVAVKKANKRIPIIAGTGGPNTEHVVDLTRKAKEIGVDAALVVTPYYNRPGLRGLTQHFTAVAQTGLPVILYHVPARTGCSLKTQELLELAKIPGVSAIKEASGDLRLLTELCKNCPIPVLTGDDDLLLPSLAVGAKGSISVVANVIPREWSCIIQEILYSFDGIEKLLCKFRLYHDLCKALFIETNPQGVKYALSKLGRCEPYVRLPLVEIEDGTKQIIDSELKNLRVRG